MQISLDFLDIMQIYYFMKYLKDSCLNNNFFY